MLQATAPWMYFTDPILRAPTLGCMLMCLAASLVGVIVFLKRQSLLGESLSHAAYPGVIIGILLAATWLDHSDENSTVALFVLAGAFMSGLLGLWAIEWLQSRLAVRYDSALCFVLASFFGVGVTMASRVQFTHTTLYRQIQVYLYGQAATMRDFHIWVYGLLAVLTLLMVLFLYKELQASIFDKEFAYTIGVPTRILDTSFFLLVVLAVVIGIRCVGVVLMSAMLIAPAVIARQFTHRLWKMFVIAAGAGIFCGFMGNYLSVEWSQALTDGESQRVTLPTGPMVVLVGSFLCILSLLFAPDRGLLVRVLRQVQFRHQCARENLLKAIWRLEGQNKILLQELRRFQEGPLWYLSFLMGGFVRAGWVERLGKRTYRLTDSGQRRAARVVRLHRLWELYLVDQLGMGAERVHRSAEEMEHILTPEIERQLTEVLDDPKQDPHHQPIPPKEVMDS